MHGSTGGCWGGGGDGDGEPNMHPTGKPAGLSPADLRAPAEPVAHTAVRFEGVLTAKAGLSDGLSEG
jgi:hypothetical protein